MGGRGAWSHVTSRMRNYRGAIIRRERISDYLLNPSKSKGKAEWLRELGYNMKNQARLQADLRAGLRDNRARVSKPNRYGTVHFQVNMEIGVNKRETVVTGWFIKKGEKAPQLATVRPYKAKKDAF